MTIREDLDVQCTQNCVGQAIDLTSQKIDMATSAKLDEIMYKMVQACSKAQVTKSKSEPDPKRFSKSCQQIYGIRTTLDHFLNVSIPQGGGCRGNMTDRDNES